MSDEKKQCFDCRLLISDEVGRKPVTVFRPSSRDEGVSTLVEVCVFCFFRQESGKSVRGNNACEEKAKTGLPDGHPDAVPSWLGEKEKGEAVDKYVWHEIKGLLEQETGEQVLLIAPMSCDEKFAQMVGRLLAEILNEREDKESMKPIMDPSISESWKGGKAKP